MRFENLMEENRNVVINVREECPLPRCCPGSSWLVRDSKKRMRDIAKRGFSSYPRTAVCSKCGNVKYFDAGSPDDDYQARRKNRLKKLNPFFDEEQKMKNSIVQVDDSDVSSENSGQARTSRPQNRPVGTGQEQKKKFHKPSGQNNDGNQVPRQPRKPSGGNAPQKQGNRKPAQKNEEN